MSDPLFLVGTYSRHGSKGIYTVRVNRDSGAMTIVGDTPAVDASFLNLSPDGKLVFAVSEAWKRADGKIGGAVLSYHLRGTTLVPINEQWVEGTSTCHVVCSPNGKWLIASNYSDGTHSVVPVGRDGVLGAMTDRVTNPGTPGPNQQSGHAHSATFSPDGKFIYACDLGLDRILVYRLDDISGKLTLVMPIALPAGSGPRHFVLHPTLPTAYVINELNSTVTGFARDLKTGALSTKQICPTLPPDIAAARQAGRLQNSCADIHFSADGKTLYGSNRGHDTLAVFAVSGSDGVLVPTGYVSVGGKVPRNFGVIPKTKLIIVANQDSDNLVALQHGDKPGEVPKPTGATLAIPAPVCVLPIPM